MKRVVVSALFTVLTLPAFGQLTITESDIQDLIGQTMTFTEFRAQDGQANEVRELMTISGADQTWDFTQLAFEAEGETVVTTYAAEIPEDAPGGDEAPFNTANLVVTSEIGMDSTNYSFLDVRDDGLYFIGFTTRAGGDEARGSYDDPILSLPLPATFGEEWSSSSTFTVTGGGVTLVTEEERDNTIDGYGTLRLPSGDVEVLRQRQKITVTFSGFTTTETVFLFYSDGPNAVAGITLIEAGFSQPPIYTVFYAAPEGGGGTTDPPTAAPTGLDPEDGALDQPTTLTLSWEALDAADTYDLQVADDESFKRAGSATLVVDESGLTETAFEVSDLEAGTSYFWRVRGVNDGGAGPWTDARSFTTAATATPPGQVTAVSPDDEATDLPTTVTFVWDDIAGVQDYRLQVATDDGFADLFFDEVVQDFQQTVEGLAEGTTYYWHVQAINEAGAGPFSTARSFMTAVNTASEDGAEVPRTVRLHASYPNPFNPATTLAFDLPRRLHVRLAVYDLAGREVATLIDGERAAGTHIVRFDAAGLPSGLYLYRLTAEGTTQSRRMLLLK